MPDDAAPQAIHFRAYEVPLPDVIDPVYVEGAPEESFVNTGVSLLLPHLEPYLIRTMNAAKPHVTSEALRADLAVFNAQEGQHFRQHRRFNEAVGALDVPGVRALCEALAADYARFTRDRSLRFNLAYAEGFEAYTTATARFSLEHDFTARFLPPARALFEWHLVEELEHRTVAFDIYEHVFGGWLYRAAVALYAQWHLLRFTLRAARCLARAHDDVMRAHGGRRGTARRVLAFLRVALQGHTPKVLATFWPGYTPHAIELPAEAARLAEHFTRVVEAAPARSG